MFRSPLIAVSLAVFFTSPNAHAESKSYILVGGAGLAGKVARTGGRVERQLSHSHRGAFGLVASLTDSEAASLSSDPSVSLMEENGRYDILGRPDAEARKGGGGSTPPAQTSPWGVEFNGVNARAANASGIPSSRGEGITVCVVDTGVQSNHPDLTGNVIGGINFVFEKGSVNPSNWGDANGHGTHVAGTIAAVDNTIGVVGVAPMAKIFAVRALDRNGSGTWDAVADGIRSCIGHASVINLSLGGASDSALIRGAVEDALAAGLIVVAAAGNESTDPVSYPARYPGVFAVSAIDINHGFASFSNRGLDVDYAGPGVGVLSTTKGSSYATYSGTSMASPHVAGVFALMLSSGSLGVIADPLGLSSIQQGDGLPNSLKTVQNQ